MDAGRASAGASHITAIAIDFELPFSNSANDKLCLRARPRLPDALVSIERRPHYSASAVVAGGAGPSSFSNFSSSFDSSTSSTVKFTYTASAADSVAPAPPIRPLDRRRSLARRKLLARGCIIASRAAHQYCGIEPSLSARPDALLRRPRLLPLLLRADYSKINPASSTLTVAARDGKNAPARIAAHFNYIATTRATVVGLERVKCVQQARPAFPRSARYPPPRLFRAALAPIRPPNITAIASAPI
uniref:Uncharacterized protein n=1 Tax=Plectus sambesii TaxID=2011161 RepID=A0A914VJG8_9BILA